MGSRLGGLDGVVLLRGGRGRGRVVRVRGVRGRGGNFVVGWRGFVGFGLVRERRAFLRSLLFGDRE